LKESIISGKKSFSGIDFNLNSDTKINKQYLDEKISNLDEKINNYNSKINDLLKLENEIKSDFSIFEEYKNNNPSENILNIEYKNNQKKSIIEENNAFALKVYNTNVNNFKFNNN